MITIPTFIFDDNFCSRGKWYDSNKYLVDHSCLMELLEICEICAGSADVHHVKREGAYLKFEAICTNNSCGHRRIWETSRKVGNRAVINLLISGVVLFSGCLPTKVLRALTLISVMVPSLKSFFSYQKEFLHGVCKT